MGKCEFPLTGDKLCDRETGTNHKKLCELHEMTTVEDRNIGRLQKYVDESPQLHEGILYLNRLTFAGINWRFVLSDHHEAVNFYGARFKDCTFREVHFDAPVEFTGAVFENTSFEMTSFAAGANFTGSRFDRGKEAFNTCEFQTDTWGGLGEAIDVLFEGATFEAPGMPFVGCLISSRRVSFKHAIFDSRSLRVRIYAPGSIMPVDRHLSIASEIVDFSNVSFNGYFDYSQDRESRDFSPLIDFSLVHFATMASAAFIEANLTKALFQYSVLDKVLFFGCEWPRRGDNPTPDSKESRGRKILYDDIMSRMENSKQATASSDELVRLYVQMKRNFEDSRDYMGASDWFYREMECRRRAAKSNIKWKPRTSRGYRLTCVLYKLASRYGEDYWRPLIILFCIYVGFSILYLMVGFPVAANGKELNYDFLGSGSFEWTDIWHALAFGLQAMTLRLPDYITFSTWGARWFILVPHFLLTVTLVPLFLLALRRKFRR